MSSYQQSCNGGSHGTEHLNENITFFHKSHEYSVDYRLHWLFAMDIQAVLIIPHGHTGCIDYSPWISRLYWLFPLDIQVVLIIPLGHPGCIDYVRSTVTESRCTVIHPRTSVAGAWSYTCVMCTYQHSRVAGAWYWCTGCHSRYAHPPSPSDAQMSTATVTGSVCRGTGSLWRTLHPTLKHNTTS